MFNKKELEETIQVNKKIIESLKCKKDHISCSVCIDAYNRCPSYCDDGFLNTLKFYETKQWFLDKLLANLEIINLAMEINEDSLKHEITKSIKKP